MKNTQQSSEIMLRHYQYIDSIDRFSASMLVLVDRLLQKDAVDRHFEP